MKGSAGTTIVLLFFISIFDTRARILKDLEKAAVKKAKSFNTRENSTKLLNSVLNDMQKARAEFDSSDFDYSILLSDNSGLFDVKENARLTSMVTLGSALYKNAQLTDAERARFNLEMGEVLYANQKFAAAERKFSLAKNAYEKASLTSDVGYLKTISNQGLLYATMGQFHSKLEMKVRQQQYGCRRFFEQLWSTFVIIWRSKMKLKMILSACLSCRGCRCINHESLKS